MQYQLQAFINSLNEFWLQIVSFVPKLLAVIVILLVGWVVAKIVKLAVKRLLDLMHFDRYAQRSGLEALMSDSHLDLSLSGIISQIVYWLVIVLFIITGANALGLNEVAVLLHQVAAYLPHVIVAILILIFGTLLARFVNRLVFTWLYGIKFSRALAVSTSAEYGIQILALFMALEQLGVGMQLIHSLFVIVFGAFFLALAIAFGLGGRDWAARVIEDLDKKSNKDL